MDWILPVENSGFEVEIVPPSELHSGHLIIRTEDPNQSVVVFLHEAPTLRDTLGQAMSRLAELNVQFKRQRQK